MYSTWSLLSVTVSWPRGCESDLPAPRTSTSCSPPSPIPGRLRRIVIGPRGRGLGRRALELVLEHAFGALCAHRVWLDVKVHNERARRAYAAAGFVHEGVLRDALLTDGVFESLAVMSVIEPEWTGRER